MNRRNWLDLSRKLVDRFDFDYTMNAIQSALNQQDLAFFGEGVLITTTYPNPFPFTMSGSVLGGMVGPGFAYDPTGQLVEIGSSPDEPVSFVQSPADPTNPRWDLIVLSYLEVGDTPVPKPSDPLLTIFLNLHDDFQITVVTGTPSPTPAYPSKPAGSIILAGIKCPPTSTIGTQETVDYSVRDRALANLAQTPIFEQENPTGAVDGSNTHFTLSATPLNNNSLLVMIDDLVLTDLQYSIVGTVITMAVAPSPGQRVWAYYVVNSPSSQNPISGFQEVPGGTIDGVNNTFTLSGNPANQASTLVMVNGRVITTDQWSLVQMGTSSEIIFQPGHVPALGQSIYIFYLVNVATFGSGAGASVPAVDYFTLSGTDITNKFVDLSHNPGNPSTVICDIIGDTSQIYGADFIVVGNQLSWNSLGMQPVLVSGSQLRVSYLY